MGTAVTGPLTGEVECKWQNLEKLMEDLTDDGMKMPGLVSRGSEHRGRGHGSVRNKKLELLGVEKEELLQTVTRLHSQVHVSMQGQEASCENMPLRQVIIHFTKQLSTGTPTRENATPSWTPQDTSLKQDKVSGQSPGPRGVAHVGSFLGVTSLSHFFALYRK